jgi:phosphoribosylformylglycinamidine synthase
MCHREIEGKSSLYADNFISERFLKSSLINILMASRIEVITKTGDTRADVRKRKIHSMGFPVDDVSLVDVYTLDDSVKSSELDNVAAMLSNPVTQEVGINQPKAPKNFDYAIEVGFLPGVTDNVGATAREIVEDRFKRALEGQTVYSSQVMFLSGNLTREDAAKIGDAFSNPVIQRASVKNREEFRRDNGMDAIVPRVKLHEEPVAGLVDILQADDDQLSVIGKQGIANSDGTRRGPLSMDLAYMKSVQNYFKGLGRNPTDVELESIAQTWSEHCKHTIFADSIDEFEKGLFKTFIRKATNEIRERKGDKDFCVSVFTDNAGGIAFDDESLVCDKVETHNSPSALDPFGGSITGIVGVNRDPMGFGMGAKPIINRYGFCFANPNDKRDLYKGKGKTQKMLSSRRIMDGVIEGVNVGGNCSGIPTPQGFAFFDESYRGKPLVFVGTVGLIPREVNGRQMHEKRALPGDYIVMVGGRVGKDGIHGATFSSEAIDSGSPATAVQIGDPITQKKASDALVKEARDQGLYRSITDNGAGGLSCSVAEMAKESGGCYVYLDRVPLKYPGLAPWEIWISESQERMTLAVPKEKWDEFQDLMKRRGVEATVIGEFTDSGKCVVDYNEKKVMDIDMEFLHNGLPARPIKTTFTRKTHETPDFECLDDLTSSLHDMLKRQNIASLEFISQQYDHEVQGGSVVKPLQGRGRVNGDATVVRPKLNSGKAVILSHGLNPSYSEIDTYDMAACSIDTAIRNAVATGADLDHLALLDNFCWCSSTEPERLGQLERACQACYDYATEFGTPFISGKDSMFNDFKGFDEQGNPIKISVLPTLLVSAIGVMQDARKAVTIDPKFEGDLVYVLGFTHNELGGSEYYAMKGEQERGKRYIGNTAPRVDAEINSKMYQAFSKVTEEGLVASAISIHRGGLGAALAKSAIAGQLGMDVELEKVPSYCTRDDSTLYSESQGRLVITVSPENKERFEKVMGQNMYAMVGKVRGDNQFRITQKGKNVVDTTIGKMTESYKSTFKDY